MCPLNEVRLKQVSLYIKQPEQVRTIAISLKDTLRAVVSLGWTPRSVTSGLEKPLLAGNERTRSRDLSDVFLGRRRSC